MINCIKETTSYKGLNLNKKLSHAYLFYSNDSELNNNVALCFAKSLICANSCACGECNECKQFAQSSHPDVTIINQSSIKVDDVNGIISKLSTLPISSSHKVFVILNAENMNETSQNKLLKSLEEPTSSNVFILTCTKMDKLLPTVLSRLNKHFVPTLSNQDKLLVSNELKTNGIDIMQYLTTEFNLTEMLNFATNENYKNTLDAIKNLFLTLKTTADIPMCASKLNSVDKTLFLPLLESILLDAINETNKFDYATTQIFKTNFSKKAMVKCLPLVEDAYKKQMSNVNFSFIIDTLLFNILKEKFLCK